MKDQNTKLSGKPNIFELKPHLFFVLVTILLSLNIITKIKACQLMASKQTFTKILHYNNYSSNKW